MHVTTSLHDYPTLARAISVHGALLPCELAELGLEGQALERQGVVIKVNTLIGPLYYTSKRSRNLKLGDEVLKSRTPSAAIDSAYMRLFMRKHRDLEWTVPSVHTLGIFHSDFTRLPSAVIEGQPTYVNGKVLGQGVTVRLLSDYVSAHRMNLERRGYGLRFLVPQMRRYQYLARKLPPFISFAVYSEAEAEADNLAASLRQEQS